MEDPDRLNRVHVTQVRFIKDKYVVILSDKSQVDWDYWIKLTQEERWNQ